MTPTKRPEVVSGADKRTKSNVEFGDPDQMKQFYETTTGSTYQPNDLPKPYQRSNINKSSIPTDFYGKFIPAG